MGAVRVYDRVGARSCRDLQLTLSLKKANIVAGEPVIVCADAQTPQTRFWARTRTQGQVSWLSVEITDAEGRAVPAITYKKVTFKNDVNNNYELHRPGGELHLEYVVPKSKNLLVPNAPSPLLFASAVVTPT